MPLAASQLFTQQKRLGWRKTVTLIAAYRLATEVIIIADSQETVGDYRVAVNKVVPEQMGEFQVIVSGSGEPSSLLDSFSLLLASKITDKTDSIDTFEKVTQKTLEDFYKKDVKLCPHPDKRVKFLIAASHRKSLQYQVWITENIRLNPISKNEPTLMGWDEPLYVALAKKFFSPTASPSQTILSGVYLFTIAEETSNYIKDPFKIAVIRGSGIWMEKDSYVEEMSERLGEYETQINNLFLRCADTSVSVIDFNRNLQDFANMASSLHRRHIDHQIEGMTLEDLAKVDDAYAKMPLNSAIIQQEDGRFIIDHSRTNEAYDQNARSLFEQMKPLGYVEYKAKKLAEDQFTVEFSDRWETVKEKGLSVRTESQLASHLDGLDIVAYFPEQIVKLLSHYDNEVFFYAKPKQ
jgi:hypothetical protein